MSDDDVDLAAFVSAKSKKRLGGQRQAALLTPSDVQAGAASPSLAQPQRKIASQQRRLDTELEREVERAALIRALTLNGIAAKQEADARARAIAIATGPKPHPPTVADAYALATARERSATTPSHEKEAVRLWELVFSLAEAALREKGCDTEGLLRAQMTSLCHRAPYYERQMQLRFAINLYERVVLLSKEVLHDAVTRKSLVSVLRKLAKLHTSVGAVEKAQQRILAAHSLQQLRHAGSKAGEPTSQSSSSEGRETKGGCTSASLGVQPSSSTRAEAATRSEPAAAAEPATPVVLQEPSADSQLPPSWHDIFDHAPDGSARASFVSAMREAMLDNSFDALIRLLNRGLLGARDARAVLHTALPGVRLTAVMVAAGAGRADVLRRLLAPLSPASVIQAALREHDYAGHSALFHACAAQQLAAADELLRAALTAGLCSNVAQMTPYAPGLVGLQAEHIAGFSAPVQQLLAVVLEDPPRYMREYRVAAISDSADASTSYPSSNTTASSLSSIAGPLYYPMPQGFRPLHAMTALPQSAIPSVGPAIPGAPVMQPAVFSAMQAHLQIAAAMAMQMWSFNAAHGARHAPNGTATYSSPGLHAAVVQDKSIPPTAAAQLPRLPGVTSALDAVEGPAASSNHNASTASVARSVGGRSELKPMLLPTAPGDSADECLEDGSAADDAPWDQFAANKALGVTETGFKEELYTSVLDHDTFSKEQVRRYRKRRIA